MSFKAWAILVGIVALGVLVIVFWARIRGWIAGRRSAKVARMEKELTKVKKEKEEYKAQKEEAVNDANEQAKKLDEITGNQSATDHIRNKWYN